MVLCPPFPKIGWDTGPIIILIFKLQKIRYTASATISPSAFEKHPGMIIDLGNWVNLAPNFNLS
jgi:hypothetical protein